MPAWPGSVDKWEIKQWSNAVLLYNVKVAADVVDIKP